MVGVDVLDILFVVGEDEKVNMMKKYDENWVRGICMENGSVEWWSM